ncbi:P-loop containing nucleoside triphosphate hydrolase protein [Dendrothele bispora CBS 962.96]|uniref:P-loop containing nucleoside triphosphate hydrolase protein n=1 Tax=Dendrothele bispora (strain CBS 962.96) TaxID=1314807 RepID=A0A4S8MP26_DENBC|nr:P-loop containing nucleoside triphosphate hydrolase protein [Dendrothele bispora CBS 962.96]
MSKPSPEYKDSASKSTTIPTKDDNETHSDGDKDTDEGIRTLHLGVHSVYLSKNSVQRETLFSIPKFIGIYNKWKDYLVALAQLAQDVYALSPVLVITLFFLDMFKSTEAVILLHYETKVLRIMEVGLHDGFIDSNALLQAVGARILCVLMTNLMKVFSNRLERRFQSRVIRHFDDYLLNCRLAFDLPMLADNLSDDEIGSQGVWNSLTSVLAIICGLFGLFSQLGFVYHLGRSTNYGALFVLTCLARPVLSGRMFPSFMSEPRIIEATNKHYLRMEALKGLVEKKFRMDILSGNIVQYIIDQFRQSQAALGNTSIERPEYALMLMREDSFWAVFVETLNDLPMVFCAALALLGPTKTNLSTVFSLRQSANSLKNSFAIMFWQVESFERRANVISRLYELRTKLEQTTVKDGDLLYDSKQAILSNGDKEKPEITTRSAVSSEGADTNGSQSGMRIEVRDVCFSYPGGEVNAKALDRASFSISPGQLVVVVGANGSGKSTLIKLLGRLYNPASGSILINGEDIIKYKMSSLRQAMAMLTQDHHLYPLSIKENIGLGFVEGMNDEDLILDAAKKGGADDIIKRLGSGMDTLLDPRGFQFAYKVSPTDQTPLGKKLKGLKKTADVSGGERQRLVAARTFMRFNSGHVKLVAVDEPSSALDPQAELNLFENIRSLREGKTVIFVTHRFGHLTKHADLILCMDQGRVIESGTHSELMEMEGQYCKLYNVQAQAFEPSKPAEQEE